MTRFAPPQVRACLGCGAPFLHYPIQSISFCGRVDWSDGAPTAWWGREPLVKCESCAALFWFDDTVAIDTFTDEPRPIGPIARILARLRSDPDGLLRFEREWIDRSNLWKGARSIGKVNFEDVRFVLANAEGVSLSKILWLRRRIWWQLNDRYRERSDGTPYPNVPTLPAHEELANMEALLALLVHADTEERDMVQVGELLRLLGRFDEAIAVLRAVPPDGRSEIRASMIERLARAGDVQVRLLTRVN